MPGRVHTTQEAEQKAACVALQGMCMMDSSSAYHPSGKCHVIYSVYVYRNASNKRTGAYLIF